MTKMFVSAITLAIVLAAHSASAADDYPWAEPLGEAVGSWVASHWIIILLAAICLGWATRRRRAP